MLSCVGNAAEGEYSYSLGLGYGAFNTDGTVGVASIRYNEWEAQVTHFGHGTLEHTNTPDEDYGSSWGYQVSRIFRAGNFFAKLGVAHIEHPLVGDYNYHLGAGVSLGPIEFTYEHNSSADINTRNTGTDQLTLRLVGRF